MSYDFRQYKHITLIYVFSWIGWKNIFTINRMKSGQYMIFVWKTNKEDKEVSDRGLGDNIIIIDASVFILYFKIDYFSMALIFFLRGKWDQLLKNKINWIFCNMFDV